MLFSLPIPHQKDQVLLKMLAEEADGLGSGEGVSPISVEIPD